MDTDIMRILIADSSSMYRKMFTKAAVETDKDAAVVCVAGGEEALDEISRGNYDIAVIDAEISGLGAMGLLDEIMKENPAALVLLTARPFIIKANGGICDEALNKGAADYMIKPINDSYGENFDAVKMKLSHIFKIFYRKHAGKDIALGFHPEKKQKILGKNKFYPGIVLIAASTGGPLALENILSGLRGDLPAPVLVVQHMPAHFAETLAENLNRKSRIKVKIARHRETVEAGTVYVAPGGVHMKLDRKSRIYLDDAPPIHGVRPAADALFESAADSFSGTGVLAVILTGMGNDGQAGLSKLKEKQACFCVAQSEKTCVVYGMPRAAVESGLADKIVDLDKISGEIEKFYFPSALKNGQSLDMDGVE